MGGQSAKKKILVVGSIAYDHVMQFEGHFSEVIMPNNYNIALTAADRHVYMGGCGGNICYNLKLLGEKPMLFTTVGTDFKDYRGWLEQLDIDIDGIFECEKSLTASAFIVTDNDQNQMTFFDPGAMHKCGMSESIDKLDKSDISWAIISPDKPSRMITIASECKEAGIPYIFDPGQQIGVFEKEDLLIAIKSARVLILNQYEQKLMVKKLGISGAKLSKMVPFYIETHGEKGCSIITKDRTYEVDAVKPKQLADPTGCGDAFRAGLLCGLNNGKSIKDACKMGALAATYSIEEFGTQLHSFTKDEFEERLNNSNS